MSDRQIPLDAARAAELDQADALGPLREAFALPLAPGGGPALYLCGHSLGLMPRAARAAVASELDRWSSLGVGGHFAGPDGRDGWFAWHERLTDPLARLLGAEPREVVAMNSLTVNLHLMLVSFFRPARERSRILIEAGAFPSDRYAVESQLRFHGLDPAEHLIPLAAEADGTIDPGRLETVLAAEAGRIALVLLPGVQYLSGEAVDLAACATVARRHGASIGFDLAHAIGNLELDLRAAEPDFAVWCSYKYLNGGPGAVGGCFVNRRHVDAADLPRFEGWWGHDKSRRFEPDDAFAGIASAEAWQLSNPPILAMAPLAVALELFDRAGMAQLRAKSVALTSLLEDCLEAYCRDAIEILTPRAAARRGAQLSVRIRRSERPPADVLARLAAAGVVADLRAPDVLRLAPVPLYNRFADAQAGAAALARALGLAP